MTEILLCRTPTSPSPHITFMSQGLYPMRHRGSYNVLKYCLACIARIKLHFCQFELSVSVPSIKSIDTVHVATRNPTTHVLCLSCSYVKLFGSNSLLLFGT